MPLTDLDYEPSGAEGNLKMYTFDLSKHYCAKYCALLFILFFYYYYILLHGFVECSTPTYQFRHSMVCYF